MMNPASTVSSHERNGEDTMPERRSSFSLSGNSDVRQMLRCLLWSVSLHLLFLGALLVVTGDTPRREFLPVTVLLAGEMPGQSGGGGRTVLSRSGGPKGSKIKRDSVGHRNSTPPRGTASGPEETVSTPDVDRSVTCVEVQTGVNGESGSGRDLDIGGGTTTLAGQGEGDRSGSEGRGDGMGHGSGSGSGPLFGSGGGGAASYLSANFSYIRDRILKKLTYPAQARQMGWKGRVLVSFVIGYSGYVENVRVVESSGHAILDVSAVKTIKSCQPFPKPPVRAELIIPIVYRIG